jgi:microsomal dipeptidase-like Zn-dependent dipeptidase
MPVMSTSPLAGLGGQYARLVNQQAATSKTLVGLVDLHTHPAAHLGFGTELFYGPPDGDPSQNFVNCNGFHGSYGLFDNPEGNEIRRQVVDAVASTQYSSSWDHKRPGWPDFPAWPTWHDRLHQQVRVEMLQRAWQGGLRVIVALAVNSHTLALLGQTKGSYDDKTAGDAQIAAIKEMISGQQFMELALTPSDVRQVIASGKLAVVIGVELDCIGNFYSPNKDSNLGNSMQPNPPDDDIRAEVSRLFASGVRYFFPVHLVDNLFGGAALYEMIFNAACRFQFGSFFAPETAPAASKIGFTFDPPTDFLGQLDPTNQLETGILGFDPKVYPAPPPPFHRNSRGLQHQGQVALDALMRLGAMIDVDHMSEKTVLDTLAYTQPANYPLFAGHNGIRGDGGNERAHLIQVATEILNRGGMFGVGIKNGVSFLADTVAQLRSETSKGGIAVGSDCSGLEQLPAPRNGSVVYNDDQNAPADALQRCHLGNRAEDINTFGFSHIGMYPDFIEDGVSSGILNINQVTELFSAPEAFVSAWESCLSIAAGLAPRQMTVTWSPKGPFANGSTVKFTITAVDATNPAGDLHADILLDGVKQPGTTGSAPVSLTLKGRTETINIGIKGVPPKTIVIPPVITISHSGYAPVGITVPLLS